MPSFKGRTISYSDLYTRKAEEIFGNVQAADESHLWGVEWHLAQSDYLHLYPIVYETKKFGPLRVLKTIGFDGSPETCIYFSVNPEDTVVTIHDLKI